MKKLCVAGVLIIAAVCVMTADYAYCGLTPAQRRAEVMEAIRQGPDGFPVLLEALDDEDALVRGAAVRGLVRGGPEAAEFLATALKHDDFSVRRAALLALDEMGKLTVEQLIEAGGDEHEDVRQLAADLTDILERWDFLPDVPREEFAPVLQLRGRTRLLADGPSGISLESFAGRPVEAQRHGAIVANHPALSPEGGFTIEMWMKPKAEWIRREGAYEKYIWGYLVDKKYIPDQHATLENHNDYQIILQTSGRSYVFYAWLGFGEESDRFGSERISLEAGKWYHFAFTYDGNGEGRFYLDGEYIGGDVKEGRGSITHGTRHFSYLVIGDRISDSMGFPGKLDRVRIHHSVIEITPETFSR